MPELAIADYYKPQAIQRQFHNSKAKYPLMEGGRGGGKTLALLWEAIYQALIVPGANVLLLRRQLTASEKGGIEDHFTKYVPKAFYKNYNGSKHTVYFNNGSKLFFGHVKAEVDLIQYQGPEYLFVGWDELTQFSYSMWAYLKGSNRCPIDKDIYGNKPRARMAGATNPNGKGSGWVKSLWIQHKLPSGVEDSEYRDADYEAISSTYRDNFVYANDAEYISGLASQPPGIRQAWLEGSWDIQSGQFFTNWELDRHVRPAAEIAIPDWQPRWIGIDWGFNHATCVLWFAQAEVRDPLSGKQRKTIVCYRELVRRGINEAALAAEILKANNGDKIANVYLSPERFNRVNEDHTIADRMGDILTTGGLPRPERANNDRVGGWRLIYTLLDTEGFIVGGNCHDLIESFPQLMRDDKDLEDAAAAGNELYLDVMESCRYGLMSYFNPRKKPQSIVDDETIRAIPDNTWKMLEHLRQQARPSVNELAVNVPSRVAPWRRN